jgi:hypothetical protein
LLRKFSSKEIPTSIEKKAAFVIESGFSLFLSHTFLKKNLFLFADKKKGRIFAPLLKRECTGV